MREPMSSLIPPLARTRSSEVSLREDRVRREWGNAVKSGMQKEAAGTPRKSRNVKQAPSMGPFVPMRWAGASANPGFRRRGFLR